MPHPTPPSALRTLLALSLAVFVCAASASAPGKPTRPGDPVISIPLDNLGFDPPQPRLLTGGATMFSLHFVDDTHLLLTFNSHGLIPRLTDGPQDEDRLVTALLVELPAGHILARTQWHTRDREQYLWPLANGLFMLRIRSRLTVIDPLRNLKSGEPFHQQSFLDMGRRIGYVSVSPGGDLLVIETVPPPSQPDDGAFNQPAAPSRPHPTLTSGYTEIHLFRMFLEAKPGEPSHLVAQSAGLLSTHALIRVPATSEGFLDFFKESDRTWLFDFQSHSGKRIELSPFDTTCVPSPYFISRSEFVAFGCHGGADHVEFSGFNFRGEEPWIQMLSGQQISPAIVTAPAAGRFAFSRIVLSGSFYDLDNLIPEEMTQEIMVIQHHDGRILLKVQATPTQRTAQNFDISPDGLSFTVIRNGNLEVYRLPAFTKKDEEQLKLAAADIPEKNEARIRLESTRPKAPAAQPAAAASNAFTVGGDNSTLPNAPAPATAQPAAQPADDTPLPTDPVDIINALSFPGSTPPPAKPAAPPAANPTPTSDADAPRPPPSLYDPDHPKPPPSVP